jgi:hypothetical protein
MLKRGLFALVLVAIAVPVAKAAEEPRSKPTLVVRLQSIDKLFDHTKFLAEIVDQDETVKQFRGIVESRIGEKGLEGFDTKKPIALYGNLGGVLTDSNAVLMLPVADEKSVLALLDRFEIKTEKDDDGIYLVKKFDKLPEDIYFRFANNYIYATARDKAAIAKDKLLEPGKIFTKDDFGVVAIEFRIDQIPDGLKTAALTQIELQFSLEKDKKTPGETATQHELKGQILDSMFTQLKSVFDDGEQVTVKFDVDEKGKDIVLEANLTAKKDSRLAGDIADLGKAKSVAAAVLSANAALSGSTRLTLPKDLSKVLAAAFEEGARENIKKEQNEAARKLGQNLLETLLPTLSAGEVDFAFDLRGPSDKGTYTVLAAGGVKNGKDLEKSLRDIAKSLPEEVRARVKLDADSEGGVAIHTLDVFKDGNDDLKRVLGDGPLYLAVTKDAIFLADGPTALTDLKTALKAKPGNGVPLQFNISVARLGPLMEKDQPAAPKVIEEVFGKNKDSDKIRISVEGGQSLKAQVKIKADAARFFAKINEQGK